MIKKPLLVLYIIWGLFHPGICAAQDISSMSISIYLKDATLDEALNKMGKLTGLKFNYKTSDVADIKHLYYESLQVTVKKLLTDLLSGSSLQFEQIKNYIIIKKIKPKPGHQLTLYGFVHSAQSGESLIGATVSLTGTNTYATISNAYGFYSIRVPASMAGAYRISCSHIAYNDFEKTIDLTETTKSDIDMRMKEENRLDSVTVIANSERNSFKKPLMSMHRLSISEIKKMPMAGGEPDILKSLQFLPGIQTSNEGTTNLSVRGGSYDQNLYLLDEAPVYNPTHTLGFVSAFNTDALKAVSIYKSIYPAQYGGRLSAVVDLRMKEGNSRERSFYGGIGLLASRFTLESPIKKGRSSFILSGRYSNPGVFLNLATQAKVIPEKTNNNKVSFYDLNIKFNTSLGEKNRLFISAYSGSDRFYLALADNSTTMNWGNTTITTRWNHVFKPSLFSNTSLLYSYYNYSYSIFDDTRRFKWKANLRELTLKSDLDWTLKKGSQFKFGLGITMQSVEPGKVIPDNEGNTSKKVSLNNKNAALIFAYFNHEQKLSNRISFSYGLRSTIFAALGDALVYQYNADTSAVTDSTYFPKGRIVRAYWGIEPRATFRLLISGTASLKVSYGRNYQFQHLLTNSSVGLPTDIWVPSDAHLKPQYSDQVAAGLFKTFSKEAYEASIEVYYRKLYNVLDFKDNAEIFLNDKIETELLAGKARAWGLELLLKKNNGRSNGWVSYTFSKAERRINGINKNEWYLPVYDHRHNASATWNYQLRKRLNISANLVFRTGGRATVPIGTYMFNGVRVLIHSKRNEYELPAYHRLDLNATLQGKIKQGRKWRGEWVFSIYNVYNRKNIFALFVSQSPDNFINIKSNMVYLIGILPTVTYNFKI